MKSSSCALSFVIASLICVLSLVVPCPARADVPSCGAPSSPGPETYKPLLDRGRVAFAAADWDGAIESYSRALEICSSARVDYDLGRALEKSGRLDEAVEAYQRAVREPQKDAQGSVIRIEPKIDYLLTKIATVHIDSNVDASIFVDGRPRGTTGGHRDLHLMPGWHMLRFVRAEYEAKEQAILAVVDQPIAVPIHLTPATAGAIRVEEVSPENGKPGASVFVDGVLVGVTPWEGIAGAGPHVVWIRRGDTGSPPRAQIVIAAQTTLTRLKARPLGPVTIFETSPPEASIKVEGVIVGHGRWEGRLPTSQDPVEIIVEQDGYLAERRSIIVAPQSEPVRLQFNLRPKPLPSSPSVSVFASLLFGGNAGNTARGVTRCDSLCSAGFMGGARVELQTSSGLSFGAEAGYAVFYSSSKIRFDQGPLADHHYEVTDQVRTHGPFLGVVGSYRVRLTDEVFFAARPSLGLLFASADDTMRGEVCTADKGCRPAETSPVNTTSAPTGFFGTEVGVRIKRGSVMIDAGLGLIAFPEKGPTLDRRGIHAVGCDPGKPDSSACPPVLWVDPLEGAPSRGPFLLGTISVAASYAF